ncbi:acyl-CoA dehydrogenase [Stella humosa]|uniref:Acyl-CoA dehydrogenase n=1 Tax=Stella humosa TaxID=94 RepID=A0A3N1M8X5_9PROT|nr:acyl-CoA dehydrogenase family protein [Stella humosa]ROQ00163.1 acyl-CoA dehydrogenase [Stella humosa]BBK30603.1 acyl-CoA dehydrogenase [Stella humosa]
MSMAAPAAVPDARGANLWRCDPTLGQLLGLHLPGPLLAHLAPHLDRLGGLAGDGLDGLAATADRNPPLLHHRDRQGRDRQWIEKHPTYQEMERLAFAEYGLAAMTHRPGVLDWPEPLPPIAKYALTYLFVQAEFGLCCPVSMTDSLTATLVRHGDPALVARYLPGLTATDLDHLTQGAMFMTEQAGGSDVGRIETVARRDGDGWRLWGEKWFCSNADAGLAMVLARTEDGEPGLRGLSLFLMPRVTADGSANRFRIVRLKEKLGTRAMPSGEIRLEGAEAHLVGQPGRGFVQMADMINLSRLSNGVRAAGLMRRALHEALHVARHRIAFGRPVVELPLMRRQLLKMMLPTEAARSMVFATAAAMAAADAGDGEAVRRLRILTPLLKFRACRDARRVTGDAMEVRGGCGYVEEWSDARLLRDAHLGSIWEGTSNVVALDVIRAIRRSDAASALAVDLRQRLCAVPAPLAGALATALDRALAFAQAVAAGSDEHPARQVATGLYYAAAAIFMAEEGSRLSQSGSARPDARRLLLARLALDHRLVPRDPLAGGGSAEAAIAGLLLDETPVAPGDAATILG